MEKQSFSLKLLSGDFYGQSFIKTVRGPLNDRPLVKSAYSKISFLILNQNICYGYSKEPSQ